MYGNGGASKIPFFVAYACHIICFVLCIIGFGTTHWYEPEDLKDPQNQLKRIGLWEACFDGYEHTSDLIGKKYYGCWWIFHKEYSYIRDWLMPPWFVAVQTMMTFAVVLLVILFALMALSIGNLFGLRLSSFLSVLQTCCLAISVTVFAVMIGVDRSWMPRWDLNMLSWSFGLVTTSAFFSAFESIAIVTYTVMFDYANRDRSFEKKSVPI
jgi:hypothetical protein